MRAALILALVCLTGAYAADFSYCNDYPNAAEIYNITTVPEMPTPGEPLYVTVIGDAAMTVQDSNVLVNLTLDAKPLLNTELSLCSVISCPVNQGPFDYTARTPALPDFTPAGDYVLTLNFTSTATPATQLLCVTVPFSIEK
ncbi:hypothetical protein WJX73_007639 [Symbiochloris irregularis]|uniref:MD-2-related lipid-recognition domain-containing protein n=1 Tax=Symbiochloris irregularis TaxID=706552 RepID=A0AAW1PWK9_9CHLO